MGAGATPPPRRHDSCLALRWAGLLTLLGVFAAPAAAQLLPFRHYTTEGEPRALPSAEVHSVRQDRLGYLWIVVYSSGLVRYDGVRMELYTEDDGLRSAALWDVVEDASGRLWATSNAGLVVSERPLRAYEGGQRVRFVSTLGGVPLLEGGMRRNLVAVDGRGVVWVGTDELGLVRYHTAGGRVRTDTLATAIQPGGPNESVRSVVARRDGSVWVGLRGGTLLRYRGGRGPEVMDGPGAPTRSVFVLYEDPRGTLWGSDQSGRLWQLREQTGRRSFVTVSEALTSAAHGMVATSQHTLLVTSEGSGLLAVDLRAPGRQRVFTRQNGLLSDVVHAVAEDAEGNLWVAQSGGLSKLRYDYRAFTGYSARSAVGEQALLPAPPVSAVQPVPGDAACPLWVGTSGGGAACIRSGLPARSTYLQVQDGLSSDYVNALARDPAGRIWIGTSEGIDAVAPAGVALPPAPSRRRLTIEGRPFELASYGGSTVLSIASLDGGRGPGGTWFTGYRWLFGYTDDAWYRLGEASGLPATVLHAVAADAAGHLWVGTRDHGLYRSTRPVTRDLLRTRAAAGVAPDAEQALGREVTGPLFERVWSTASGAPTNQIESLLWNEGEMWVATPRGLFVLAPDGPRAPRVVAHLDEDAGLLTPRVFSLARSPATGTLWAGTNAGLVEVSPRTRRPLRTVTRRDGLIDNEVWYYGSVRTDPAGRVYFGTASGLSAYTPAADRPNPSVPALHLRSVRFSETDEGYNEIALEYAATSFASEGGVRYRTRLRGYEEDWSAPTAEAKIRYTNLSAVLFPKTYTFEVAAHNGNGVWTPAPLAYSFSVRPPWWLRWWAVLLYLGVAALGVAAVVRAQRARLLREVRQRARIREAEHQASQAASEQAAAEARARALQAENERNEAELTKARELEQAYHELQTTQAQLIQAEKMASLGQLTAGIAHEIKNPLNFVNNFAKATIELVGDLREELAESEPADAVVESILEEMTSMSAKIAEHGDRADRIVKGMLQHSRGGGGAFHEVRVNTFVDEYVNLAFHGMRALHSDFNVDIVRDFDEAAEVVEAVPQELGRVLVNLFNNAFYAVHERQSRAEPGYEPRVAARTRRRAGEIEIRVEDNGPGVPEAIRQRVFEPFFTTKPTGEGTGLGLSLSYDIVTQMHGGRLQLETVEGGGSAFIVTLPAKAAAARTADPLVAPVTA